MLILKQNWEFPILQRTHGFAPADCSSACSGFIQPVILSTVFSRGKFMDEVSEKSEMCAATVADHAGPLVKPCQQDDKNLKMDANEVDKTAKEVSEDPYLYTKMNEFTSEVFKIEIGGLPTRFGFGELKKLLNGKLHLNAHKLKLTGRQSSWAFVTFKCEEDRENALKTLAGYMWKGRALSVKKANPAADPLIKKRKDRNEADATSPMAPKRVKTEETDLPVDEQLKMAVMPLWKTPYERQLQEKRAELKKLLVSLARQIEKVWPAPPIWLQENKKANNFKCCPLEDIRPSPITEGYRNKCEFSVGWDPRDERKTVGFRLARYSAGSMSVADASGCRGIVPENILAVGKAFQEYVQKSDKDPYDPKTHAGYWRQLTVRSNRSGDALAIVVMHPQKLSQDELCEIQQDLKRHFTEGAGKSCLLAGLYFQAVAKKTSGEEQGIVHVHGETHIKETLLDLSFRISPTAFFQINTPAAEVLYTAIGQVASVDSSTILLDICCGTGTIGISLAKKVQKVIGIDMIQSAIEDARHNAELNNLTNVEFRCGKVEDVVPSLLYQINSCDSIIAIVDPPRAGLHHKVIRSIRGSKRLHRLVYVSCDAAAASKNIVDLCRPESNQYRGRQFEMKNAIAVDLFPHTNHCELIFLLEREADPVEESSG